MSEYNRDNRNLQGEYQQGSDYQQGGAGLAGSYYNESSGGQQQYQAPPYRQGPQGYNQGNQGYSPQGGRGYNPQGSQGYHGQGNQGYSPRRDDRHDDRRDDYGGPGPDGPDGERGVMGALAGGAAGAFGGAKIGGKTTGYTKTSAVVGALAGAFAGHKLQDAASDWKDDKDEKKEDEKRKKEDEKKRRDDEKRRDDGKHDRPQRRRGSRSRSRSRSRSQSRSSSRSSHHRRRDDRRNRSRSNSRSRSRSRSHDRSRGFGSRSGHYAGNFTSSSRDIELETYGDYSLRASCRGADGSYQSSSISLNKYLENIRGSFRWVNSGGSGDSRTVTVQPGDTLRNIASRLGTSFDEIARHNGLSNPDLIHPGQVLQIPGGGGHCRDGNFGASARRVRLVDGGRRLEAELGCGNGEWAKSSVVLDERIANNNGTLRFV